MKYIVRWVSEYAILTTTVESSFESEEEIFSKATDEFVRWHGFDPTEHGFMQDDYEEC